MRRRSDAIHAHQTTARVRRIGRALPIIVGIALGLSPLGCSTSGTHGALASQPEHEELAGMVVNLSFGPSGGSATPLGDDRFLTSRHVVPDFARWTQIDIGSGPMQIDAAAEVSVKSKIDGVEHWIRMIEAGVGDEYGGDWAVIESLDPTTYAGRAAPLDAGLRVAVGAEVLMLGYPSLDGANSREFDHETGPLLVRGRVVRQPVSFTEAPFSDDIFCVRAPLRETYHGMSGGPVFARDGDGRLVVVGIYKGTHQLRALGIKLSSVHVVRYLPQRVIQLRGAAAE